MIAGNLVQSASIEYIELMTRKSERGLATYTSYSLYSPVTPSSIYISS